MFDIIINRFFNIPDTKNMQDILQQNGVHELKCENRMLDNEKES